MGRVFTYPVAGLYAGYLSACDALENEFNRVRGLVELEAADSVGNWLQTLGLVNRVATIQLASVRDLGRGRSNSRYTIYESPINSTDRSTGLVDGKGDGEFASTADGLANHLEIGGVGWVDIEYREGIGAGVNCSYNISCGRCLHRALTEQGVRTNAGTAVAAHAFRGSGLTQGL